MDIDKFAIEVDRWATETFCGGDKSIDRRLGILSHLNKETCELNEGPINQEEIADCIILLLNLSVQNVVHSGGRSIGTILRRKHEKNKRRVWGTPDKNGVVEHIRSPAEALNNDLSDSTGKLDKEM